MFVGRTRELEQLNTLYSSGAFEFAVLYGRRRVGKTTLLAKFIKDKDAIFFVSPQHDDKGALRMFSDKINSFLGLSELSPYASWDSAFKGVAALTKEKRVVLVLDEFPYIAQANSSVASILQNAIDHEFKNSRLFLIVCGSSMSFMEKGVLGSKSPLYGRATSIMRIEPFDFATSCGFFPNYPFEKKLAAYAVLGGIPKYLEQFDDRKTLKANIIGKILNDNSLLYEEPKNFLKEELREPALYNAIIEAIAQGASRLNEIATAVGIGTDTCAKYLNNLMGLHVVKRETPITMTNKRSTIYKICDYFFSFWYRYVFENSALVELADGEALFDLFIKDTLNDFIGRTAFEDVCREYLWTCNLRRSLPFIFTKAGRWWGTDPIKREQAKIDIVSFHKNQAIFSECKWSNAKVKEGVLNDLQRKADLFSAFDKRWYYIFSKSGFSAGLIKRAEADSHVNLIDLRDLQAGLIGTAGRRRSETMPRLPMGTKD